MIASFFFTFSLLGNGTNRLSSPAGLYYDEANQDLYIANSATTTSTVLRWRVGDSNGTVVAGVPGVPGNNSTQLKSPMGITLDQWNNLYVADRSNSRVQLFCNGSLTGITIAGSGTGGTTISAPYDVKLDSRLNLYVTDNSGARVSKFTKL
jgi:DNA-binding beta-propeller fold protein YncE